VCLQIALQQKEDAMRWVLMLCCAVIAIVVATSISRSDSGDSTTEAPATSTDEPITGQPVTPTPGSETPGRDPFSPYDVGGQGAVWSYDSLSAEEKAAADRGRDVKGWDGVNDAYRQAAMARAAEAAAEAAAIQLGVQNLGATGVVP
jgi:hypothetical protein